MNHKIEIFQSSNGMIEFNTNIENETIWASLDQIAKLFSRDKSGISRHIKNIFKSEELDENSVVAKIATTASDGKTYQVDYYNWDCKINCVNPPSYILSNLFKISNTISSILF